MGWYDYDKGNTGKMIGYIRGILKETNADSCILDVHGIGYVVYCSRNTLSEIEGRAANDSRETMLHTRLIHREDTLDLYGFLHGEEKLLFDMLITVSGIGPKQAIKILGASQVHDIVHAVVYEDSAFLMQLSGIGRKKSQQIILELKEKLKQSFDFPEIKGVSVYTEAISALEALGFTRGESKQAVENALEQRPELKDIGQIVELALKNLS